MAKRKRASWPEVRADVLAFATGLPGAYEDFPWGDHVVKVNKKIFVFLGPDERQDGAAGAATEKSDARQSNEKPTSGKPAKEGGQEYRPGMSVKLADSHAEALSVPGATPTGYGLGRAGWVSILFEEDIPPADVLCDWVEESYRLIALKRLIAQLDAPRDGARDRRTQTDTGDA